MTTSYERRALIGASELRAGVREDSGSPFLHGLAVPFDQLSQVLREDDRAFREVIRPGAFSRTLGNRPVVALIAHQSYPPLGNTETGSLQLRETESGLEFELDPPPTPRAAELVTAIQRGDLKGVSIGFNPAPDGETWNLRTDPPTHVLTAIDLFEISFVVWPAFTGTSAAAAVRSLQHYEAAHAPPPAPPALSPSLQRLADRLTRRQPTA